VIAQDDGANANVVPPVQGCVWLPTLPQSGGLALSFPKRRRLDPQRAQIDIPLPAVVNLIVDAVKNRIDSRILPLAERLVHIDETVRRYGWPDSVEFLCCLVPEPQQPRFRAAGIQIGAPEFLPLARRNAMGNRHCHLQKLLHHLGKWPHRSDLEAEQLVFRKRRDHPARKPAMALPILH
jgi:hypothetical protein